MEFQNLVGKRFGKLVVLSLAPKTKNRSTVWLCKCDCGNEIITKGVYLKKGETRSCGCLAKETRRKYGKINCRN